MELAMGTHLDLVTATCASSRFAVCALRSHELQPMEFHMVTRMTTVSSLMYMYPFLPGEALPTCTRGRDEM